MAKKKNMKSKGEKLPDFCGLKSDASQEEIVSCNIEKSKNDVNLSDSQDPDFCGMKSKEGKLKMRTKYNIKKQAITHSLTLKQQKRQKRILRREMEIRKEKMEARKDAKTVQVRRKPDLEEIKLNKLIQDHTSDWAAVSRKKKWYED